MSRSLLQRVTQLLAIAGGVTLALGCRSVTERMQPTQDKAVPATDGTFLHADNTRPPTAPVHDGEHWWAVFQDPALDELMKQVAASNPDVAAAAARVDQSLAVLGTTRSARSPVLRGDASLGERRDSLNNLLFPLASPQYERYRIGLSASWEVDLWGRVRSMTKRDALQAEAAAATHANVLLSLEAMLAQQYFAYRSSGNELALLGEAVRVWEENLALEESRLQLGAGVEAEVARAQLRLHNAQTGLESARRSSGKFLHAMATLTGTLPSKLAEKLEPQAGSPPLPPTIPAGLPSSLLTRRPDLLAADRRLQSAAVQVGIRRADFLPKLTLVGNGGFASLRAEKLFEADGTFFDIGPQLDIPLFQGSARKSAVEQARAQWREAAAVYQSAFLTAVREVDDALLEVKSLGRELDGQLLAVKAAASASAAARDQFDTGLGRYGDFLVAEQTRLENRIRENALHSERLLASIRLIQALGGSWTTE